MEDLGKHVLGEITGLCPNTPNDNHVVPPTDKRNYSGRLDENKLDKKDAPIINPDKGKNKGH